MFNFSSYLYFQALQKIDSLSGGQKSRVAFAVLCGHSPNFLIMDEPTNHLDIQTIEALGHALCEYKVGSVQSDKGSCTRGVVDCFLKAPQVCCSCPA